MESTPFRLIGFRVVESVVKFNTRQKTDGEIRLEISPSGKIFLDARRFELVLGVRLLHSQNDFEIFVNCVGDFEFKNEIVGGDVPDYFLVNAPAIVFPYLRSYLMTVTAISGIGTVSIPVQNLQHLKEKLEANIEVGP